MWLCPNCGEESEDNYDRCWNCSTERGEDAGRTQSTPAAGAGAHSAAAPQRIALSGRDETRAPMYEYKVVPFIGHLKSGFFGSVEDASEVSKQLETLLQQQARVGWEFVTVNDVNIEIRPGCLAGLFGNKTAYAPMDQVVFRRPRLER